MCALVTVFRTCALPIYRPHSDPLSVGASIAVVEMRAAVEAIRLASVLPSPAGPVTVEHRHERGRSIAERAVDHLPRPRDAGMAMGRSEERRVGKRWVSTWCSRGAAVH